jgi:hypothetical protein
MICEYQTSACSIILTRLTAVKRLQTEVKIEDGCLLENSPDEGGSKQL